MKIIIYDNGVFVERERRAFIMTKNKKSYLVEGDDALAVHLDVSTSKIQDVLANKGIGGVKVRLANLGDVKAHLGSDVPVIDRTGKGQYASNEAKPCQTTWRVGNKRFVSYTRSMSACKRAWGLDNATFEKIVAKVPGWQKLLPDHLDEIKVVAKIPNDVDPIEVADYDVSGIDLQMKTTRAGKVRVTGCLDVVADSPATVIPELRRLLDFKKRSEAAA